MTKNKQKEEKYTNQRELQSKTKSLINEVKNGERYIILRYTEPVGVLIGMEEYKYLISRKNCNHCLENIKKSIEKASEIA